MKIGDRVVPVKKSIGYGLNKCKEWNFGKEQGYLYIVGEHSEGYVLNAFKHMTGGSLYKYEDVKPYNGNNREFEELKNGVCIKDLEVDIEWHKSEQFDNAIKENEDILCLSCMDKNFVYTLNKGQARKLLDYLSKTLDYCDNI